MKKQNKEKQKIADAKYYLHNKEKCFKRHKNYVEDNKEHVNEYGRDWRKNNLEARKKQEHLYYTKRTQKERKMLQELQLNGCAICGYNKCGYALHEHHANPEDKKFLVNVSGMRKPVKQIIDEVNKCILLCANCHGEIHELERASTP